MKSLENFLQFSFLGIFDPILVCWPCKELIQYESISKVNTQYFCIISDLKHSVNNHSRAAPCSLELFPIIINDFTYHCFHFVHPLSLAGDSGLVVLLQTLPESPHCTSTTAGGIQHSSLSVAPSSSSSSTKESLQPLPNMDLKPNKRTQNWKLNKLYANDVNLKN